MKLVCGMITPKKILRDILALLHSWLESPPLAIPRLGVFHSVIFVLRKTRRVS